MRIHTMLVLHNPKNHHYFTWQQTTIMHSFAGTYKQSPSPECSQNKVLVVRARVSHKELHGGDEFYVTLRERKYRD